MVSRKHTKTNGFNLRVLLLSLLKGDTVADVRLLEIRDLLFVLVVEFFTHCDEKGVRVAD